MSLYNKKKTGKPKFQVIKDLNEAQKKIDLLEVEMEEMRSKEMEHSERAPTVAPSPPPPAAGCGCVVM